LSQAHDYSVTGVDELLRVRVVVLERREPVPKELLDAFMPVVDAGEVERVWSQTIAGS
jgi:hypothetical protein